MSDAAGTGPGNGPIWEIVIEAPNRMAVPDLEEAISDLCDGVAAFEDEENQVWRVTGYAAAEPDATLVGERIAGAAAGLSIDVPPFRIARTADVDWVAEVEKTLKPVRIGPYYVYGSHVKEPPPADAIPLHVDAGQAFGTGTHETTSGCLLAFERLYPDAGPANPLDVGTGSGILAIALAKRYGCRVLGSDIDPVAVQVAQENAGLNGTSDLTEFVACLGLDDARISARAPYDLIIANIVAGPLVAIAPDVAAALAPGGAVVLSGILDWQRDEVAGVYEAQGLRVVDEVPINEWRTLVLKTV